MIVNFRFKNYVALTDVPGSIFNIFSKLRHVLWSERKFGDWLIIEYGWDSGSSVYQPPSFLSGGFSLRPHLRQLRAEPEGTWSGQTLSRSHRDLALLLAPSFKDYVLSLSRNLKYFDLRLLEVFHDENQIE